MMLDINGNAIEKKQYFNRRDLVVVEIPQDIVEIGNWAFADCVNLRKVILSPNIEKMGKDVFLGCRNLTNIAIGSDKKTDQLSEMIACAFLDFNNPYLKQLNIIGDSEWIVKWDDELAGFLHRSDLDGFSPFLAGGEEDYEDKENSEEYHIEKTREKKTKLVLMRLDLEKQHPISDEVKDVFVDYINKSQSVMNILFNEVEKLESYFSVLSAVGYFDIDKIEYFMRELPDDNPELAVYLITEKKRYEKTDAFEENVWDKFEL